jgi:hypothetical protein
MIAIHRRAKIFAVPLAIIFFWAALCQAELKFFPAWEEKQCGAETLGCYTQNQIKNILKVDLDLQLKIRDLDLATKTVAELELMIDVQARAADALHASVVLLDMRLLNKQKKMEHLALRVIESNSRDVFGGAMPWVVVALFFAAIAGFAGGFYTAR